MGSEFVFTLNEDEPADLRTRFTEIINGDDLTDEFVQQAWEWYRQQMDSEGR